MLMPATRPCLLAYVPRAMCTGWPVSRWSTVAQSPADQTPSADVCLALVDEDGVRRAELDPGRRGQLGAGADADAEDDEVGVDRSRRR